MVSRFVLLAAAAAAVALAPTAARAQFPFSQDAVAIAAAGYVQLGRDAIVTSAGGGAAHVVAGGRITLESSAIISGNVMSLQAAGAPAIVARDPDARILGSAYLLTGSSIDASFSQIPTLTIPAATVTLANLLTTCTNAGLLPSIGAASCFAKDAATPNAQLIVPGADLTRAALPAENPANTFASGAAQRQNVKVVPRAIAAFGAKVSSVSSSSSIYSYGVFVAQHDSTVIFTTDACTDALCAQIETAAPGSAATLPNPLATVFTFEKLLLDPDVTVTLVRSAGQQFLVARDHVRIQKGVVFDVDSAGTQNLYIICLSGGIVVEDQRPGTSDTLLVNLFAGRNILIGDRVNLAGKIVSAWGSVITGSDSRATVPITSVTAGNDVYCNPPGVDLANEGGWVSCGQSVTGNICCPANTGGVSICCASATTRCVGGLAPQTTAYLAPAGTTQNGNPASPACCAGDALGTSNADSAVCCPSNTYTVCSTGGAAGTVSGLDGAAADAAGSISGTGPLWCCNTGVATATNVNTQGYVNNNRFCGGVGNTATVGARAAGVCFNSP